MATFFGIVSVSFCERVVFKNTIISITVGKKNAYENISLKPESRSPSFLPPDIRLILYGIKAGCQNKEN